jgi:photosystem II stability/assembly factor-like uncharacterized protein
MQDTVYQLVASGTGLFAARLSGLYRSRDKGATWDNAFADVPELQNIGATAIATVDDVVLVGVHGAIIHSADDGETWQICPLPTPAPLITDIAISPDFSQDGLVVSATAEDGIYFSEDGGQNWIAWNFGLFDMKVNSLAFYDNTTIFAGTECSIFRSHNGGKSWRELAFPPDFASVLSLATTATFVIAGTENNGLLLSKDFGEFWTTIDIPSHIQDQAIQAIIAYDDSVHVLTDNNLLQININDLSLISLHDFETQQALTMCETDGQIYVGFVDGSIRRV